MVWNRTLLYSLLTASLIFVILAITVSSQAGASPQTRIVFGPEQFTRTTGATNIYTDTFSVPSYVTAPYTLHVQNGQLNGQNRLEDAISSGAVSINGAEIVHKSDFNQNVATIDRTVTLQPENSFTVTLDSAPDSFIIVTVSGVINVGDLNQPRSGHTAALLPDGAVLIAGGRNSSGDLASAERFDPLTLTFNPLTGNLGTARSEQTASTLADQNHLLVAGQNQGGILASVELFDPATGLFSDLLDTVRIPRSGHTATVLLDGRVLIVGGQAIGALGSAEAFNAQDVILFKPSYDPQAGVFTVLPNALSIPRWDHTATMLADGKIMIIGGRNNSGYLASVELFDPATETFTPLTAVMTTPRAGHSSTLLPDGRALILGGQNDTGMLSTAEVFDPALAGFNSTTPGLITPRANHTATLLYFGEVLVTGGENGTGILNTVELYGPPPTDTSSPGVVEVTPPNGATGVDLTEIIGVRFSEPVDVTTLNAGSITLTGSGTVDSIISPSASGGEQGLLVFVVPRAPLSPGTTYTLTLTSAITDTAGNPLIPFTSTFTTVAAPVITSVTPDHGPADTAVSIIGENFDPSVPTLNVVKFNSVEAVVASATATLLETSVPFDAPVGAGSMTVTTRGGTTSASFTVENPAPVLVSLSPDSAVAGSGAFALTLNGSNFIPSSSVHFGNTILTPTFISSSQLQASIPASAIASPGTVQVTVTNPPPGGGTSNAIAFTVIGPVITSLSPSSGPIGTPVTISGLNFDPTASNNQVKFNNTLAIIASSSTTTIQTVVPQGATTGPVTVTTPQGTAESPEPFTVVSEDFNLQLSPSSVQVVTGASRYSTVSATGLNGFSGWIYLSIGTPSAGLSVELTPPQMTPFSNATLKITAASTAVPGLYSLDLTGTAQVAGETIRRTASLSIEIIQSPGTTSLTGRVISTDDKPIPGVLVTLGDANNFTDAGGTFFLQNVPTGSQMILVDGRTAIAPGTFYPEVTVAVELIAGEVNALPAPVYLPEIDIAHPINLPLDASGATTQEVIATTPAIPDLELVIPAGTTIIDPHGNPVSQITITSVPADRSPMPLPSGVIVPLLLTIQPGGSVPSRPLELKFPNWQNAEPGTVADMYFFDVTIGNWAVWGTGTVTEDGRQVVTNPGFGLPRFAWHFPDCGGAGSSPGPPPNPRPGDPVDISTGIFALAKTELVLPGTIPITLERTYQTMKSPPSGGGGGNSCCAPTGVAGNLEFNLVLQGNARQFIELLMPDGTRPQFRVHPDDAGLPEGQRRFINTTDPHLSGAVLTGFFDRGFTLTYKDGTIHRFDVNGRLVAVEDRNGNTVTIARRTDGGIDSISALDGRSLSLVYNESGYVSSVTDSLGRTTSYAYSAKGELLTATDANGGVTRYTYTPGLSGNPGQVETITDARGITYLTNEYSPTGRIIKQTLADGGVYTFRYEVAGGGCRFSFTDGPRWLSCVHDPEDVQDILANPQPGQLGPAPGGVLGYVPIRGVVAQTTVTDPEGHVTVYRFGASSYHVATTDALGQTTLFVREAGTNRVREITDPLGRKTTYTYDAAGNVKTITDAEGHVTTFEYEPSFNRVTKITDALGNITTFTYDTQGNLIATTDPLGKTTTLTYDAQGHPITVTDPLGNTTQFEYDASGNLTAIVDPLGNRTTRAYDAASRLITLTNPLGQTTSYHYDALNRVIRITDAIGSITRFSYDANGNLLTVTDANGNTTSHTYDVQDRLATRTDPLGLSESYQYDGNGNLVQFTDRKGQIAQFTYDELNRRVLASYADGSSTAFTYDAVGRLTQTNDTVSGLIQMSYDNLDRLASEVTPQGVVTYTYDAIGRRTSMSVNGLSPVVYQYDAASRLTQVAQGSQVVGLGYDFSGRRTSLSYPNGTSTSYFYDDASRLTEISHHGPSGVIEDLLYTYDAAGNRISFNRTNPQADLPQPVQAAYNAANQTVQFNTDTLTYDANGNLTFDGVTTYTWDARNRLIGIQGPDVTASFVYDALGRRVSKTINGETTQYLYDGNDIVAEIQGGVVTVTYLRSLNIDEPFLRSSAVAEYYHTDALGSTLALTDQGGVVQTTYSYDPFGNTTIAGTSANPFQYTGRENDGTGLYYYRTRYYSQPFNRFISQDKLLGPIELLETCCRSCTTGLPGLSIFTLAMLDVKVLNSYVYAGNQPTNFTDPFGLEKNNCGGAGRRFHCESFLFLDALDCSFRFPPGRIQKGCIEEAKGRKIVCCTTGSYPKKEVR
jgi:RHS repeat-associated protein